MSRLVREDTRDLGGALEFRHLYFADAPSLFAVITPQPSGRVLWLVRRDRETVQQGYALSTVAAEAQAHAALLAARWNPGRWMRLW